MRGCLALLLCGFGIQAGETPEEDLYLSPAVAGSPFCINPHSSALQAAIKAPDPKSDDMLRGPDLADDVHFLVSTLRKNYSGWGELVAKPDFDVEAFFRRWESEVRDRLMLTFRDGVERYYAELRRHHRDNHLGPYSVYKRIPAMRFQEYQISVPANFDARTCTAGSAPDVAPETVRVAPVLTTHGIEAVLTASSLNDPPVVTLSCGKSTFKLEKRSPGGTPDNTKGPAYEYKSYGKAGLITLRRFAGQGVAADMKQFDADYEGKHRKHKTLIIDLRGMREEMILHSGYGSRLLSPETAILLLTTFPCRVSFRRVRSGTGQWGNRSDRTQSICRLRRKLATCSAGTGRVRKTQ